MKLVAGWAGNTYALVADAVESTQTISHRSSCGEGVRCCDAGPRRGLSFRLREGGIAGGRSGLEMLLAAAIGSIRAVREIRTPHQTPAPWTLLVLVAVLFIKYVLFRRVSAVGEEADAARRQGGRMAPSERCNHVGRSFVGISIALGVVLAGAGRRLAQHCSLLE